MNTYTVAYNQSSVSIFGDDVKAAVSEHWEKFCSLIPPAIAETTIKQMIVLPPQINYQTPYSISTEQPPNTPRTGFKQKFVLTVHRVSEVLPTKGQETTTDYTFYLSGKSGEINTSEPKTLLS